ncbi:uncharacterized protein [Heptranchias perlo]|uniref:uncharacterized protein n=1 Tax=Heptranchias perlo TaxID=212740 RepID=UPI00355A63C9
MRKRSAAARSKMKEKVEHNSRQQERSEGGRGCLHIHIPLEETVLQINGRAVAAAMTTCHAGGPDKGDTQEHVAAPSEEEEEEDTEATLSLDLTLSSTSSETDTACPLEARLKEGSACGETPGISAQEPGWRERIPQVPARRRARSLTSSAAEESDEDFDGPGFRRRLMGVNHQMLGALESLPESLHTMRRGMEESSSNLAQGFVQSLEPILSNMERVVTSISTPEELTMMQHPMTDVAASIAAQTDVIKGLQATVATQTAAMEAQTAAIVALGTTVERGFQSVTALQQSVLQLITRIAEAPHRESGSGAMAVGPAVLSKDNSIPAPTTATPPVPLLLPIGQPGQTAVVHAEMVQTEARPSRPRAA